jgi:hypothetical protein
VEQLPPPQDLDAEEYVLGAMLLAPSAVDAVLPVLGHQGHPFYRHSHAVLYRAVLHLHGNGTPADPITVAAYLEERGQLGDIGGRIRMQELAALVPATGNAVHYARIVADRAASRRLITTLEPLMERARAGLVHPHELEQVVQELRVAAALDSAPGQAVFMEAYEFVDMQVESPPPLWGNAEATIIPAGGLVLAAGRPGVGKTTWVIDLACHLAAGLAYPPVEDDKAPTPFPVPRPLRIALIENEGPLEMFRDKLAGKLERWEHPFTEAGGYVGVQTWRWGAFSFADADAYAKVRAELDELAIDLVIGDPLAMLGMEGVGSPAETRAFVQLIRGLGLGHGRAFLFLHHFRERVEKNEDELARISGAWGGHLDTLMTLQPMGREEELRLAFPKLRWGKGKPLEPLVLGRVYVTASYVALRKEGDAAALEPLLVDLLASRRTAGEGYGGNGWGTYSQLAAELPGGARRSDAKKALEGNPHLFVMATGAPAKVLGAKAQAQVWGLVEWPEAPAPAGPEVAPAPQPVEEQFPF